MTMAMAAGKFGGKLPKMTDNAFKPPTEAAMAMTGKAGLVGGGTGAVMRAALPVFFGGCAPADFSRASRLAETR
jgi:hypothetical protein